MSQVTAIATAKGEEDDRKLHTLTCVEMLKNNSITRYKNNCYLHYPVVVIATWEEMPSFIKCF